MHNVIALRETVDWANVAQHIGMEISVAAWQGQ